MRQEFLDSGLSLVNMKSGTACIQFVPGLPNSIPWLHMGIKLHLIVGYTHRIHGDIDQSYRLTKVESVVIPQKRNSYCCWWHVCVGRTLLVKER